MGAVDYLSIVLHALARAVLVGVAELRHVQRVAAAVGEVVVEVEAHLGGVEDCTVSRAVERCSFYVIERTIRYVCVGGT
jgi:hypothetical protein